MTTARHLRTLWAALALLLALVYPLSAQTVDIVSTAGSPYEVVLENGTVVSQHSQIHTAIARAITESLLLGETVYVRRALELRVTAEGGAPPDTTTPPPPDTVDTPPPEDTVPPAAVTDFRRDGPNTLAWTEVGDGAGGAANYDLRHGCPAISWGAAWTTTVVIGGTEPGEEVRRVVSPPSIPCEYQMVPFRGTLNVDASFGPVSPIVELSEAAGDTARTDTTEVQLQVASAAWFPDEGRIDWDPWDADVGGTLVQCWYTWAPHPTDPERVALYGRWPAECPDEGVVSDGPIPVIPDSLWQVRCRGTVGADAVDPDAAWTEWAPGDDFALDCGGVARWASEDTP